MNDKIQELLKDWLKFASDVVPTDKPGEDWLLILTTKTELALYCTEVKP